jgi:hypothetical protein
MHVAGGLGREGGIIQERKITRTMADYSPAQLQDLVDELDDLLSIAATAGLNVAFTLEVRVGTEDKHPDAETLAKRRPQQDQPIRKIRQQIWLTLNFLPNLRASMKSIWSRQSRR